MVSRNPEIGARTDQALERVQLSGLEDRFPSQLSGGQQQRVALARALVIEPSMLLLDEPLANLDAKLREEMRFFIRSLQKDVGITTVYVTHDQAEAMVISDRIVVMFDGVIHQIGDPTSIYEHPATEEVANFIGLANFIPATAVEPGPAGNWQLRTEAGQIQCAFGGKLDAGEEVRVVVRPEAIELVGPEGQAAPGSTEDGLWNVLDGVVQNGSILVTLQVIAFSALRNSFCRCKLRHGQHFASGSRALWFPGWPYVDHRQR